MKKQTRKKQAQRSRKPQRLSRHQANLRAEDELWHEMRPLLVKHNLRHASDEGWTAFAAQVMFDSTALYDETEFQGLLFDPAEALHAMAHEFDAHVLPPEEYQQLPQEEREDLATEAYVNAVAGFIYPEFQSAILDVLVDCRKRLKREKRTDMLALAAAVEKLLRDDDRPVIWGVCGILQRAFQASLQEASEFEEARAEALKAARAVQPDVTEEYDLEDGSPADLAYWEVVDKTPGLSDYLDRKWELEEEAMEEWTQLDGELAAELFDPEELHDFLMALVENLKAHGIDLTTGILTTPSEERDASQVLLTQLPESIKAIFLPDRFRELLDDLDGFIEEGDDSDPMTQRARQLHDAFSEGGAPYWENLALAQFIFNALIASMLESSEQEVLDDDA